MRLPYETVKTDPGRNVGRLREILGKFGASEFYTRDRFDTGELEIGFIYKGMPVRFPIEVSGYAKLLMRSHRRMPEKVARVQAARSMASMAVDYLKSCVAAVESGLLSFEDVFLAHFVVLTHDGEHRQLGQVMKPRLAELSQGHWKGLLVEKT